MLIKQIKDIFNSSGENYGSRRIKQVLAARSIQAGRYKVREVMDSRTNQNHN